MNSHQQHELMLLDQAGKALSEAKSFDQIKVIRDKAEAVRKYAQSAALGLDIQNRAAEVKLRAERQAGKLLSNLTLRGGDRRSKHHDERLKLADLGISRNQSTRWQIQASIPEKDFREYVRQTCSAGRELTSAGLIRLAQKRRQQATGAADAVSHGRRDDLRLLHQQGESTGDEVLDLVAELKNHHQVLEGLLQPLYTGENDGLRSSDCRALKYLLRETGALFERLEQIRRREGDASPQSRNIGPHCTEAWQAGQAIPVTAFAQRS